MYTIKVRLKNLAPYIQNNPLEVVLDIRGSSAATRIGKRIENAETTGFKNDKGYFIPNRHIWGAMREASKKIKMGRGSLAQLFKATIVIEPREIPMVDPEGMPITQYSFVYNDPILKKEGEMVFKPRVAFENWIAELEITCFLENIPEKKVLEILEYAGFYIGIGARRPVYGRFSIL